MVTDNEIPRISIDVLCASCCILACKPAKDYSLQQGGPTESVLTMDTTDYFSCCVQSRDRVTIYIEYVRGSIDGYTTHCLDSDGQMMRARVANGTYIMNNGSDDCDVYRPID